MSRRGQLLSTILFLAAVAATLIAGCDGRTVRVRPTTQWEIPVTAELPDIINAERMALRAFYEATGGAGWTRSNGWNSDLPLGDWYGVSTNFFGQVITLGLPRNNLKGKIPKEIGAFASMRTLNLEDNQLSGNIPNSMGSLNKLERFNIADNEISGRIPDSMQNIRRLKSFVASNNHLSGSFPAWLNDSGSLRALDLRNNEITGDVPITATYGNPLMIFALAGNEVRGCVLARTTVYVQHETDQIGLPICPQGIGYLIELYQSTEGERWRNSANWLSTKPLDQWHGVSVDNHGNPVALDLSGNGLHGQIPYLASKAGWTKLERLDLSNNELTGEARFYLDHHPKLKTAHLHDNMLHVDLPINLWDLQHLETLTLAGNVFTGCLPPDSTLPSDKGVLGVPTCGN